MLTTESGIEQKGVILANDSGEIIRLCLGGIFAGLLWILFNPYGDVKNKNAEGDTS